MRRVACGCIMSVLFALLAAPLAAEAREKSGSVYRIGWLLNRWPTEPDGLRMFEAFYQGLRDHGYVEGETVTIEFRSAELELDRLPALAAELVRLRIDVLVAAGNRALLALKGATTTIPIVMLASGDPVATGLVASLARPGGNVTGMTIVAPEVGGKRLQLLKEVVPGVSRVAFLWNRADPYHVVLRQETQAAAQRLGVTLHAVEVREAADDLERALDTGIRGRADGLLVVESPLTWHHRGRIIDFAARNAIPAMYGMTRFVDAGGLMAYAADFADLYRRAGTFLDKILKGADPAALPVEQPTKFGLAINLKTARALGLTIPPSVLVRADKVIE